MVYRPIALSSVVLERMLHYGCARLARDRDRPVGTARVDDEDTLAPYRMDPARIPSNTARALTMASRAVSIATLP